MKKWTILGSGLCMAALAACSSSSSVGAGNDAGKADTGAKSDGSTGMKDGGTGTKDAAKDTGPIKDTGTTPDTSTMADVGAPDAGPARHVLVTYSSTTPTTMFAVSLPSGHVDGTVTSTDYEAITDTSNALAPFFLNQSEDIVSRIDPSTWKVTSSWSIALPPDGGTGGSDPYAVVLGGGTDAYVVRYLSNVIDVIDTSQSTDAGTTTGSIDLSSLVQANDPDGIIEASAGVYVASTKLLYVVLGNIDRYSVVAANDYDLLCEPTQSTVIAIDTTTNTLKSLGGAGMGGGIALAGYDPTSVVYDATGNRLLIVEAGCNGAPTTDGGMAGAVKLRGIEAVDLTANTSAILLDNSTQGFPGSFVYINPHQAVVGFSYPTAAFAWDPTTTALGAAYANAPQVFDYDGNGNLVGASINYGADGGESTDITSMSLASGMAVMLASNVIAPGEGYVSSVGVWPRP